MENKLFNHRFTSTPYIIQLDNDYYSLTQEVINQNADVKTRRRKDWQHIKLQFISLENGVLQLALASPQDKEKFDLTIKIEKNKLHVSCSCGQPVEKLCRHAYVALSHVSYSYVDSGFFKKYRQGGPVELALKHRKHFRIQQTGYTTEIKQNNVLGTIYRFSDKDRHGDLINLLELKATSASMVTVKEETTLSYILMYSRSVLPFLIPAEAVLNKTGSGVKGFVRYIQSPDDPMIQYQSVIIRKSFRLMEIVKKLPGTIKNAVEQNTHQVEAVLQLWRELLPFIKNQLFVFKSEHRLWRLLKRKPRKSGSYPVKINDKVPEVQFELIDKGEYYRLLLKILINGAVMVNYEPCRLFVFSKNQVYLLGSLRDAAIIELWYKLGGFLTIFKDHFDEFEELLLFKLSDKYFVKNYSENHRS